MAAIGLFTALSGVLIAPGPAAANPWVGLGEVNDAVASSGPTGTYYCSNATGAIACFKPYGDTWYVRDTTADGRMAVAVWKNSLEPGLFERYGECHNHLGANTWAECRKDYPEESHLEFFAQSWNPTTGAVSNGNTLYTIPAS